MAKDPVCGMTVDEKKAAATATEDGKTYYFCSAGCKDKFTKNPQQYRAYGQPSSRSFVAPSFADPAGVQGRTGWLR